MTHPKIDIYIYVSKNRYIHICIHTCEVCNMTHRYLYQRLRLVRKTLSRYPYPHTLKHTQIHTHTCRTHTTDDVYICLSICLSIYLYIHIHIYQGLWFIHWRTQRFPPSSSNDARCREPRCFCLWNGVCLCVRVCVGSCLWDLVCLCVCMTKDSRCGAPRCFRLQLVCVCVSVCVLVCASACGCLVCVLRNILDILTYETVCFGVCVCPSVYMCMYVKHIYR